MVNNRAEIIKNLRRSLLMDTSEMSRLLGIAPSTYCNYEAGKRSPRLSVVRKLRDIAKQHAIEFHAEEFLEDE